MKFRAEEPSDTFNNWLWNVFLLTLTCLFAWTFGSFIVMYKQERRSFRRVNAITLFIFFHTWVVCSFFFSIVSLASYIFGGWEMVQKCAYYFSAATARLMATLTFKKPVIKGKENLLSPDTPCVFVANHQSCIDIALAYQTNVDFRWVSKWNAYCIPGVGGIMLLCGHVPLLRRTKRGTGSSKSHMLKACHDILKQGKSVWIFPQGTRDRYKLLDFKHGAFTLATEARVPIIPISIDLPLDAWFDSPMAPVFIIHPPIYPDDPTFKEKDALTKKCFNTIVNGLHYGPEQRKLKEMSEKKIQ